MHEPGHQRWFVPVLLAGVAYTVIGRTFAWPTSHVQAWLYGAWIASAHVFAAHIAYEHFWVRRPTRVMARHAALGVAIGAFGLAVVAIINVATRETALKWLVALVAWPAITGIPAYLAALAVGAVLARLHHTRATGGP